MPARTIKLLSVGHSYCVALNRRLMHEIARAGGDRWEVVCVAPDFFAGDLRPVPLEREINEACHLEAVPAYFTHRVHLMLYGWPLRRLLRRPWDIVHCWEEPYTFSGAQIAFWSNRTSALVFYTYQNIVKNYPPPFKWIERYVLHRSTSWIAGGELVREALFGTGRGYNSKPSTVLPLGVDTNLFSPDAEAGRSVRDALGWSGGAPPVLGYLGRFVEEKGIGLLMRVLDNLRQPWRALFVGGGPLEDSIRNWAESFPGQVRVVTGVKHAHVPAYLNAMDFLCAPSQTRTHWREQLGRMLIEAFAAGVPVIASDSGEIPYVAGGAGMIVGESDEEGWRNAIKLLLDSERLRADLRARGLERAHHNYSWPVVARGHMEFFESSLAAR